MARNHRSQLRLAVATTAFLILTACCITPEAPAQSLTLAFGGDGVFPVNCSINSQRWYGVVVDTGSATNSLVGLQLSGPNGGQFNPSLWLLQLGTQQEPRPTDDLDGVASAGLGGTRSVWTIGPFTGSSPVFPFNPHSGWCMGTFGLGSGGSFRFYGYFVDQNGAGIQNWYPGQSSDGGYNTQIDDEDKLEWHASPAAGVDPLAVTPNQLQPDNDNGAGDSTYTFRVQFANGRNSGLNLPPRWQWVAGNAPGEDQTTMVSFDAFPERAPQASDGPLIDYFSVNSLNNGDTSWLMNRVDDPWLDHTGDYISSHPPKGLAAGGSRLYEMRTGVEVLLFLDGNIQRPHFMLRENNEDNVFTDNAGARYFCVIQPTDFLNFLDNLFLFRYDPPGPDNQDILTGGFHGTSISNGYVSLPAGDHTYEFAATDDFFPPRGVANVRVGWPGNQVRYEYWHPFPGSPSRPDWHTSWVREFRYTELVNPFGYPYDSQDPNDYLTVNPVLSGFPYFAPAVRVAPHLPTDGTVAPENMTNVYRTGGDPRFVPTIRFEEYNDTTQAYDLADVVSPFESVGPQGGPQGPAFGADATRPNQPTHYTNDDTIRPNWANIFEQELGDGNVDFQGGKWTQSTTFTFLVNYWRKPSRSPDFIRCMIRKNNRGSTPGSWRGFTMSRLDPADSDYSDGCVFFFQASADQLPDGGGPADYNYYFVASDGSRTTIFPNRPARWVSTEGGGAWVDYDPLLPSAAQPIGQADLGVPTDPLGANDYYWFRVNHPPVLDQQTVLPDSAGEGSNFTYYVTYTDTDGEVLRTDARGDEPFEASIFIDLFGDPLGENYVSSVSAAGALNYTTQIGAGYGANALVDAARPMFVRIEEASNPAAIGLTYEITANDNTSIQTLAPGFDSTLVSPGDRFEILQWFQGTMDRVTPSDNVARDGIRYQFNTANLITLGPGVHRYYFQFRDDWGDWAYPDDPNVSAEGEAIRFPVTSEFAGPEVLANSAPLLTNFRFTPDAPGTAKDGTTATGFQFFVTYTDLENNPPAIIRLGIDGTGDAPGRIVNMVPSDPSDTVYSDGAVFQTPPDDPTNPDPALRAAAIRLAAGDHIFRAQASDGDKTYPPKAAPSDPLLFSGPPVDTVNPDPANRLDSVPGPSVAPNTPPTLEFDPTDAVLDNVPGLDPDSGTQSTQFTWTIIYKDTDVYASVRGNRPIWVRVYVDGVANDMAQVTPSDTDYTDGAVFQFQMSGLIAGTAHSYYFRANDGLDVARRPDASEQPRTRYAGPIVDEPPKAPKSLAVFDVPNDQGGAIDGTFNPSDDDGGGADDVDEYRVYYDTAATMANPTLAVTVPATGAGAYTFTHSDPTIKGQDLFYVVRAFDLGGNESVDSNVAGPVRAADNIPPDAPANLTATNPGVGKQIDLSWSKSADDPNAGADDVTEYRVYRALTSGAYTTALTTVPSGTSTYPDTATVDGTDYFYVVRAFDGENESANSNEAGPITSSDDSPPLLSAFDPVPGARNVPRDTKISFTATDTGAGVNTASGKINASVGGVAVTGATSFTPLSGNAVVRFTFTPAADFAELAVVQVDVEVEDLATPTPRKATKSYRFTVEPPPTYAISGTITEDDGAGGTVGVPNVTVYAGALSGRTDATGAYTILGLTNGTYEVRPARNGKAFVPVTRSVAIADADVPGVDFTAVPGYNITGHVRSADGPMGNVRVTNGLQEAVTNANGVYQLKNSPAGTYVVRPILPGFVFTPAEQIVTLPTADPGGSAADINFRGAPETFTVGGRVSTSDGGVLENALVEALTQDAAPVVVARGRTDIAGNYQLDGLLAGTYDLRPSKAGFTFEPQTLEVAVGPNAVNNDFVAFELFTRQFQTGLAFVAVPADPANNDVVAAFGTDAIARWDPRRAGVDKYVVASLEPDAPILDLGPGRGYFVDFAAATTVQVGGRLIRVTDPFSLNLQNGFNMLGNPYPATLPWANLAIADTGPVADFGFILKPGTRDYELVSDLPELKARKSVPEAAGFWLQAQAATFVTVNPVGTADAAPETSRPPKVDDHNWVIPIVARTIGGADLSSRAGITDGAALQAANPPALPGGVDVYFTGNDNRQLALDVRAAAAAKTEWSFAVTTELKNVPVTVSLPDLTGVPAGMRVTLVDAAAGKTMNARQLVAYTYDSRDGGERPFRLVVEPDRGGNLALVIAAAQANARTVEVNYTLAKAAAMTVRVLNLAGREVAVVQRAQDTPAGQNTAVWNLLSANGTAVPAGTYLIELQAVAADGQQARAVRAVSVSR